MDMMEIKTSWVMGFMSGGQFKTFIKGGTGYVY
jgi:hypothetical protein